MCGLNATKRIQIVWLQVLENVFIKKIINKNE